MRSGPRPWRPCARRRRRWSPPASGWGRGRPACAARRRRRARYRRNSRSSPARGSEGLDVLDRRHVQAGFVAVAHLLLVVLGPARKPGLVDRRRPRWRGTTLERLLMRSMSGTGTSTTVTPQSRSASRLRSIRARTLVGGEVVEVARRHADPESPGALRQRGFVVGHRAGCWRSDRAGRDRRSRSRAAPRPARCG